MLRPDRCCALLLATGLLLAGCEERLAEDDNAHKLHGTWLRETEDGGVRARRILVLQPDGAFQEQVRIVDSTGKATVQEHSGTWIHDGTNLKRKYTLMNGQPPSRLNVPFVTFEIRFESRNDFTGIDHIHRNKVHYRRVPAEAQL